MRFRKSSKNTDIIDSDIDYGVMKAHHTGISIIENGNQQASVKETP